MEPVAFFLKAFLSLLAIMNPFSSVPIVMSLTGDYSREEIRAIAFKASLYASLILLFFLVSGDMLFRFMGITLPAFKVGGGVLLFLIAINLVQGEVGREKGKHHEIEAALQRENVALIPLAMPLLAGPGAITTVLVLRASVKEAYEMVPIVVAILLSSFVAFLVYSASTFFYRILGRSGISLISRISGILLLAISVQFITEGLKVLLK
ncbi:MAG: NAAT family transporter [Aquificae bacterium]|nr:NAAT family transporter [Aquificota bacterium]